MAINRKASIDLEQAVSLIELLQSNPDTYNRVLEVVLEKIKNALSSLVNLGEDSSEILTEEDYSALNSHHQVIYPPHSYKREEEESPELLQKRKEAIAILKKIHAGQLLP